MRVLLVPAGSHGDVHPLVGLGVALRRRGHDVHLITAEPFRELAGPAGFSSFTPVVPTADFDAMTRDPDLWHPWRGTRAVFRPEPTIRATHATVRAIADLHRPGETVVIAGLVALGARLANERLGVPLVTAHLQPMVMASVVDPPLFPTLRMRRWWPHWVRRLLYAVGDRFVMDPTLAPPLNAVRRDMGLPPVRNVYTGWLPSPDLVLGLFPEWFGRAPDWPATVRLTGFVRYDEADTRPVPADVAAFLAAGDPPVVFTFGSAMRQGAEYFAAAVDACRRLGRRGLLLARGREQIPADLPPTVVHAEYAPFSGVFPAAAAVVHHGGIGTCAQGLAAGVPQLVMPLGFDQPDNAARLERLGVGRALSPKRFTGRRVADALRALLETPGIAARCEELAKRTRAGDPAREACELIEALAGRDHPRPGKPGA